MVELAGSSGAADAQFVHTDVTDLAAAEAMIGAADERYGSVDVLVNCVGWDQLMFFTETTPELWEKIIRLNYVGLLNCTKAALAYMIPQQRGSIVSISSDASRQGEPREAVYGGVKAAINSFMKSIAKENGRAGIRCNVVCPGRDDPGGRRRGRRDEHVARQGLDVHARAAREGGAVAPAAQDRPPARRRQRGRVPRVRCVAGHITGQVLSVSGGYTMIG